MRPRPQPAPPLPDGFVPLEPSCTFVDPTVRLYSRVDPDGATIIGTWITSEQADGQALAQGGFLLAFADFSLSHVAMGITAKLSTSFLRPAKVGEWLQARVAVPRRTATLIFADAIATVDGHVAIVMNGILRPCEKRS